MHAHIAEAKFRSACRGDASQHCVVLSISGNQGPAGLVGKRKSLQKSRSLIGRQTTKGGGIVGGEIVGKLRFVRAARGRERGGKRGGGIGLMAILRECIRSAGKRHERQNDGRSHESSFH